MGGTQQNPPGGLWQGGQPEAVDFLATDFLLLRQLLRAAPGWTWRSRSAAVSLSNTQSFFSGVIQPEIRRIDPLAKWFNEEKEIRPIGGAVSVIFQYASVCEPSAERTFWEKATILHRRPIADQTRLCHPLFAPLLRPVPSGTCTFGTAPLPNRTCSRGCPLQDALLPLRLGEARARPGIFVCRQRHHAAELKRDYMAMQAMLFGAVPTFEEIMEGLAALEDAINRMGHVR